jgi:diguanylate cyclase (GGDEF)-like protein
MISRLQNWIARKIALGGFSRRRDIVAFAVVRAFWTSVAAVLLNLAIYQVVGRIGFLNIVIPPDPVADSIVTAFVAGPIALIAFYVVGEAIYELAVSRNEFERLSRTDPLTGLLNRRAFVEAIAALEEPYTLAILDIDRFKAINDTHGHSAGDQVLVEVSHLLRDAFGERNTVARLGGEEFGIIIRNTSKSETIGAVNAFRDALAARTFAVAGAEIVVTLSAGVSQGDGTFSYSMLLTNADKALYLAKASGRNRVVHADELAGLMPGFNQREDRIAV